MQQEREVTEILDVVKQARKQLAELCDSADPVPSTRDSLRKVEQFLNEIEKEVVKLPVRKERATKKLSFFVVLMPIVKLLTGLLAAAEHVMDLLQR